MLRSSMRLCALLNGSEKRRTIDYRQCQRPVVVQLRLCVVLEREQIVRLPLECQPDGLKRVV